MTEALDRKTVGFYLQFEGDGTLHEIDEPVKFDACNFVIEQEDNRLGRDVSFAAGKASIRFSPMMDHRFDRLVDEYSTKGFEADVKFILRVDGIEHVIGQLDFAEAETDMLTFFECKVIQENTQALIKRRSKVKVDILSETDLDGNSIKPLRFEKVYLRAVPMYQESTWEMANDEPKSYPSPSSPSIFFNPAPLITKSGIENTLSPSPDWVQLSNVENPVLGDYAIVEAANTLRNCNLTVRGTWNFTNCVAFVLRIKKGVDFASSQYIYKEDMNLEENDFTLSLEIPEISRNERLFLYFNAQSINSSPSIFYSFDVSLKVNSISLSSLIDAVKLGDAMRQVVKSISGKDIDAPRFLDPTGEFHDQYITDGLRIRNVTGEPFNLSLDDILDYLKEVRGDYEVTRTKVFFGIFDDFYRDEKIGEFDMLPFEGFDMGMNKEYSVNTFEMKYSKYSSDDEAEGNREAIHCELQMMLPNRMVENNKAINIKFIRDSFMLEKTRKKSIEVRPDTVTSDDGDKFIIDCVKGRPSVNESLVLFHQPSGANLILKNDSSFNWEYTGIEVGMLFDIYGGENIGFYVVRAIGATSLTLQPFGTVPGMFHGASFTQIKFRFDTDVLMNRTSEGFDSIVGATTPSGFSNLLFSPKRNILNYYGQFLKTATMFRKGTIKMTNFLYNRDLGTKKLGENDMTIEGDDILPAQLPENARLTPFIITSTVICDFSEFIKIKSQLVTNRGYIDIRDTENKMVSIYPKKLDLDWKNNILHIEGELKN